MRPDIVVLRGDSYCCGVVEVKFPKYFHDGRFDDRAVGQVFNYLVALSEAGMDPPVALLTDYNNWAVCTLPQHAERLQGLAMAGWDPEAPNELPSGGVRAGRLYVHTLVEEAQAIRALGVPEYARRGEDVMRTEEVFRLNVEGRDGERERDIAITRAKRVNADDFVRFIGTFLVCCMRAQATKKYLTTVCCERDE
jgi:hypothetical protein